MKVLVCTVVHNPTDARIFRREIEALLNAGHEVTAIAPWQETTPGRPEVHRVTVPRAVSRNRFTSWRAARGRLRDLIPTHDLVIVHDPELLAILPWREARRFKVQVVWDVHEDLAAAITMKAYIPKLLRGVLSRLVRLGEKIVERRAVLLLAERGYQNRFTRKHELVLNLPLVGELPPLANRKRQAIYVGSITYERGLREMLLLAEALEPYAINLRLIGECPNADAAAEINAAANVNWEGSLPNAEAMAEVQQSLVGLSMLQDQPNYQHSMPTKILEYMASGVLVVTTPLPLAAEIAENFGIVLDSYTSLDYNKLAADINAAISAVDFENRISSAHLKVLTEYNWNVAGREFVKYLETLVKR
jgi:glycosyltransferase involved in cell wall biosynthesis